MKEKLQHFMCSVLLVSFGFLAGSECDPEGNDQVRYEGLLIEGAWANSVTIQDDESRISLTTWDETIRLCYDGDVDIEFFGTQNLYGFDCQEFHYNPDNKDFTLNYTYGLLIIPIEGCFTSDDTIRLSIFSLGAMFVRRVE